MPLRFILFSLLPFVSSIAPFVSAQSPASLSIDQGRLVLTHSALGANKLRSPAEGLWSIGTGWRDDAPADWHHGGPDQIEQRGPWTIATGTVATTDGTWEIRDQYRVTPQGALQAKRRWHYTGAKPSGPVVLSVRYVVDAPAENAPQPFLPGINYYGNPSGTRIDASRVPTWSGQSGEEALYEEHRYPLPFAAVEQAGEFVAALHTRPSRLPFAAREDLWWSLGLVAGEESTELTLRSGPTASNGERGVVKARQTMFLPYERAHLVGIPPGAVIEKQFMLQLAPAPVQGHGFRLPLWTSIDWFDPRTDRSLPHPADVMAAKLYDTFDRWHEDDQCQGFRTRPPGNKPWIMMGWADRAEVPPRALLGMDLRPYTDQPDLWKQRAADSLDFLTSAPTRKASYGVGFPIVYDYQTHRWLERQNPLSQAQALNGMMDAITEANHPHRDRWMEFVATQLDAIADRILKADWRPVSTNEAFAIAPLVKGSDHSSNDRWMEAATKLADHTIDRHLDMQEPYWGGTLDARCEDKEGAWAALQGFAAMYRATDDPRYLRAAVHAGDVCLSYLYVWDVMLPPGRLADHDLKTRGWTSVSVQNQHLDVFGVVFTPTFWELADWTGDPRYREIAKIMFVSCGQMTDLATGVQGEQLLQTNYEQHDPREVVEGMRGDYAERWNIYWITAHFLTAAADFEKLGVDWRSF
ncbi:hypothetical protein Mal15_46580 [Stieleria maiorica]|uniref:Uncharacterized protein n=1 Tax=Stieleria maiorica TaxID=2795974 RepID=A0A5B9MKR8_9BACT|nr:hypothetical protein [Stieleria maiorica]QEG00587.1 hypothetical protein Mal15_46580 [Stieleria maiorica]